MTESQAMAPGELELLRSAHATLAKALTAVDWQKVPVVFSRDEVKALVALLPRKPREEDLALVAAGPKP